MSCCDNPAGKGRKIPSGLLQIPADFCCAELASACLEDGGQYVYFREADPLVLLYVGEAEPEGSLIPA